ncbi:hypothetical protein B0H13DRAFT_1933376 [Mycena leptocephala]|nr:hypothetical protein B0H13DRAFT_1933376 [Mycena leptocephala]
MPPLFSAFLCPPRPLLCSSFLAHPAVPSRHTPVVGRCTKLSTSGGPPAKCEYCARRCEGYGWVLCSDSPCRMAQQSPPSPCCGGTKRVYTRCPRIADETVARSVESSSVLVQMRSNNSQQVRLGRKAKKTPGMLSSTWPIPRTAQHQHTLWKLYILPSIYHQRDVPDPSHRPSRTTPRIEPTVAWDPTCQRLAGDVLSLFHLCVAPGWLPLTTLILLHACNRQPVQPRHLQFPSWNNPFFYNAETPEAQQAVGEGGKVPKHASALCIGITAVKHADHHREENEGREAGKMERK